MKLTLSGKVTNVTDAAQLAFARSALFTKHPKMKSWPGDHQWQVQELDGPPFFTAKEKTARWMVHQSTWGVLTTTSANLPYEYRSGQ
eukprot:gene14002-7904_t